MKDKLYKTNKKAGFYRMRKTFLAIAFLGISATALTLPYRYVAQAINASQAAAEVEVEQSVGNDPIALEISF